MASVEIDMEVRCTMCGASLDYTEDWKRGKLYVDVSACASCLKNEKEESRKEGMEEGREAREDEFIETYRAAVEVSKT